MAPAALFFSIEKFWKRKKEEKEGMTNKIEFETKKLKKKQERKMKEEPENKGRTKLNLRGRWWKGRKKKKRRKVWKERKKVFIYLFILTFKGWKQKKNEGKKRKKREDKKVEEEEFKSDERRENWEGVGKLKKKILIITNRPENGGKQSWF